MSSIKHFRTELRLKIDALEAEFTFLSERMRCSDPASEEVARTYLERLIRRIARKLSVRETAESVVSRRLHLIEAHSANNDESLWTVNTRNRAFAAMDVASAALDEAAHAAVAAWLAENVAANRANHER